MMRHQVQRESGFKLSSSVKTSRIILSAAIGLILKQEVKEGKKTVHIWLMNGITDQDIALYG